MVEPTGLLPLLELPELIMIKLAIYLEVEDEKLKDLPITS